MVASGPFRAYTGLLTVDGLLNGAPGITLDALRSYFPLQPPATTPYPVPPNRQFVLYYAPALVN